MSNCAEAEEVKKNAIKDVRAKRIKVKVEIFNIKIVVLVNKNK